MRDIAKIGIACIALLGVLDFLSGLNHLTMLWTIYETQLGEQSDLQKQSRYYLFLSVIPLITLTFSIILWFAKDKIASFVIKEDKPLSIAQNVDLFSLGCSLIGIYLISVYGVLTVQSAMLYYDLLDKIGNQPSAFDSFQLLSHLIPFAIGILLFVKSSGLKHIWQRLQQRDPRKQPAIDEYQ